MTATLSVDALHDRLICDDEITDVVTLAGTDGAVVSASVVADTGLLCADRFPAASMLRPCMSRTLKASGQCLNTMSS